MSETKTDGAVEAVAYLLIALVIGAVLIAWVYFPLQKAHRGEQNKLQYRTACLNAGGAVIRGDCIRPFGSTP